MYSIPQIRHGFRNTKLILRELNKFYYDRVGEQFDSYGRINLFEEDWNNLIIIDACRYDMFKQFFNFPGDLINAYPRSPHTREFLQTCVDGKELTDTIYNSVTPTAQTQNALG